MASELLNLPVEIFDEIASLLRPTELVNLRLVCRRFNQQTFRHLFNPLWIDLSQAHDQKLEAISVDEDFRRYVPSLCIHGSRRWSAPYIPLAAKGWITLKELILDEFASPFEPTVQLQMRLFLHASNLQKLELCGDYSSYAVRSFVESVYFMPIVPRFRALKISRIWVQEFFIYQFLLRFKDTLCAFSLHKIGIVSHDGESAWLPVLEKWKSQFPSLKKFSIGELQEQKRYARLFLRLHYDHQDIPDESGGLLRLTSSLDGDGVNRYSISYSRSDGDKALQKVAELLDYNGSTILSKLP